MNPTPSWTAARRLGGLRRFAVAITVLNLLGHSVLGFEQSWAQPLVALAAAYGMELFLEVIHARVAGHPAQFVGGPRRLAGFLLSAHITGLAVAMLLYANERLAPVAFAAGVAVGSKAIFRVQIGKQSRHFLNPSNFGITVTLLLFPWVGIAPPYHFTENTSGAVDWLLPALVVASGTVINFRFTGRLPLIAGWLGGFLLQGAIRSWAFNSPVVASWIPMTGLAFVLYTFYMVTDPATTPSGTQAQVAFGVAVAATYGLLMAAHIVFGLFFALTIVCTVRGIALWVLELLRHTRDAHVTGVVVHGEQRS